MENQINWLAIVLATLVPTIVGFVYYHQKVVGQAWMDANGFTLESLGKGPQPILYVASIVLSFLLSFFVMTNVTGEGQNCSSRWT